MPPSADDKLIEEAVAAFSRGLQSDLPLRHFGEFHDQEKLKKVVELHKEKVFKNVFEKVWTRERVDIVALVTKLNRRMDKEIIPEWVRMNQEHEFQSVGFLQRWVDILCNDFSEAVEYQLFINPDMELDSLKNYVRSRKLFVATCFDGIWKPGNGRMQEERKSKLEKYLKTKEEEVFERHRRNLESKSVYEGQKLVGEVRTILLERSRQLKSYVVKQQGQVSTAILRGMVEDIRDYLLNGKGSAIKESHEEIFNKLMANFEAEIHFLADKPKETMMTANDVIGYAERFDEKLRLSFSDNVTDNAHETQQDTHIRAPNDPNEERRRRTTMQEILNQLKDEQLNSLELEENESEGLRKDINVEGDNESMKNADENGRPAPSTAGRKMLGRSSRRLKRSMKDTDFNDLMKSSGANATAPEERPSQEPRIGRYVAKKMARTDTGDNSRRSSRILNKAKTSISAKIQTSFPKTDSRKEKGLNDVDLTMNTTMKCTSDVDETPHPNSEDDDIVPQRNMMSSSSSPPRSFRVKEGSGGNKTYLEGSPHKPKRSKYVVSRRNSSPMGYAERPQSKLRHAKMYCDIGDKCPKQIAIVEGDCPMYSCNVCKKKFKWKKYLKYHGESCGTIKSRSFICTDCGKGFHTQQILDRHCLTHTREKPFQCPQCPERFAQTSYLQSHIRSHANSENAYFCHLCNLKFLSASGLHEHNLTTHEGMFPFTCKHCDKRYDSVLKLKKHAVNHADERPFKCSKCEAAFTRWDILYWHLKKVHHQQRKMAHKLAYDASVAYLLKETKNESCRDIPISKINVAVVDHVIKKGNLLIANA